MNFVPSFPKFDGQTIFFGRKIKETKHKMIMRGGFDFGSRQTKMRRIKKKKKGTYNKKKKKKNAQN